ncbi:MAG: glycoside hydrolase family 65 protein [Chitinophagales bacterium]|nr:glycoside hydrolase family 65 protein [Chitinophagales bacterium]
MKSYLKHDEWKIIEEGFHPEHNRISESVFSIGNGRMGQRANFEEHYSGDSLQGSYIAGVYYPDKTRVGWWKNGYPEYFAKVINSVNWIGINIKIAGEPLDMHVLKHQNFRRELDMKTGILSRSYVVSLSDGSELEISSRRICSIADPEIGAIEFQIKSKTFKGDVELSPYLDFDVENEDSNYDEKFWEEVIVDVNGNEGHVMAKTRKLDFTVAAAMEYAINGSTIAEYNISKKNNYVESTSTHNLEPGDMLVLNKYVGISSNMYADKKEVLLKAQEAASRAMNAGFEKLLRDHSNSWQAKWEESDITIEGDVSAQQGIRFNIFQLSQTYTGVDDRLNIGPKGFTGEKYGGSTYWDTEAYCIPFYLATADQNVARNLLIYRYKHLQKAIANAEKLGFSCGAALYPMVTMNGEECHNEWEITFEEIHRNGAIAHAIYDYIRYTGDKEYLSEYGLEVLIAISRFWAQRVNWSEDKKKYVMLGVTGPNEYENNVNNNWYSNYIAKWCMTYTMESIAYVKENHPDKFAGILQKSSFVEGEMEKWKNICDNMYFPESEEHNIYLQQEGFLDKELLPASSIPEQERPISQNWSWDRILRSCFIKQADVLQGMYFFEDHFDLETIRRNFDFYEPMTAHESSLSPCVHAIIASKLGKHDKAYEMYIRTARLDLDDYNNDTEDGCHITSMGGTWMSFVKGFAGMRIKKGMPSFDPFLPKQWKSYSFNIRFRNKLIHVSVSNQGVKIDNNSNSAIDILVYGEKTQIDSGSSVSVAMNTFESAAG